MIDREKLLFRYSSALERGDFEVIAAVLREAEFDPILMSMIAEINDAYEEIMREETKMIAVMPYKKQSYHAFAAAALAILVMGALLLVMMQPQPEEPPIESSFIQSQTASAQPQQQTGLCAGETAAETTLYSDFSAEIEVGVLPAGTTIQVMDQSRVIFEETARWVFVTSEVGSGWASAETLTLSEDCPPLDEDETFYFGDMNTCIINGEEVPLEECNPLELPGLLAPLTEPELWAEQMVHCALEEGEDCEEFLPFELDFDLADNYAEVTTAYDKLQAALAENEVPADVQQAIEEYHAAVEAYQDVIEHNPALFWMMEPSIR